MIILGHLIAISTLARLKDSSEKNQRAVYQGNNQEDSWTAGL